MAHPKLFDEGNELFTPIHLLPQYSTANQKKYEERWHTSEGRHVQERVLALITRGAGEDFLQWDFEQGSLPILENMWDLKGINLGAAEFDFPHEDNFEAIDFSYSHFYHCTFKGATFSCNFSFVKFFKCRFERCVFAYNGFYGSFFGDCLFDNCDFWDSASFTNSSFKAVVFNNCLIPENIFFDCRFDEKTSVDSLRKAPAIMTGSDVRLENNRLAAIYQGIKEAYVSGKIISRAREYQYKELQAATRFNSGNLRTRISGFALELLTGYGLKPTRVLMAMILIFALSLWWFTPRVGFGQAMVLVSGAMFTFGAYSELLRNLGPASHVVYVATAFAGMIGVALFVTVWAVKWLRQ